MADQRNQTIVLSNKLENKMRGELNEELTSKIKKEKLNKIVKLYHKSGTKKGNLYDAVSNDITSSVLRHLSNKYASDIMNKIPIVPDIESGIRINIGELPLIKPYVEFIVKSNGTRITSWMITFEVSTVGDIKENQVCNKGQERYFQLGTFDANISLRLIEMPFVNLSYPRELISKTLSFDLSDISIPMAKLG